MKTTKKKEEKRAAHIRNESRPITGIQRNESTIGEPIEQRIYRMVYEKEPINDAVPTHYQTKKEGVQAAYNIRADKFDIALDAMTTASKIATSKGQETIKKETETNPEDGSQYTSD